MRNAGIASLLRAPAAESRNVPAVAIGTDLPGGYAVRGLLAEGGTSRVYRAEQLSLRRPVVVKMLHPTVARAEAHARLRVEACAMSNVRHPGSVLVYDLLEDREGMPFLVMEHVAGRRLTEALSEPVPLRRMVDRVVQLLSALDEAHASGVIHRDVTPDNVMIRGPSVRTREHVTVIDYGLALVQQGRRLHGVQVRGVAHGTPGYMSPEQLEGDVVDARTDVYSAAIILRKMLERAPESPSGPPPRLVAAVERALADDRRRRTASAARFALELEQAMSHG